MKKAVLIISMAVISWGAFAQPTFEDKAMDQAYGHYIALKDALVASSSEDAGTASASLVKAIQDVKGGDKVLAEAKKVADVESLDGQRKAFTALSNEMATLVRNSELAGEVYLEYCPMANSNQGGYWLSNEKEIRNPYFGDMMLKCGSVKETIN